MQYLEYSYLINKNVSEAFTYLIDLVRLQSEHNYFQSATISTNDLAPNEPGKQYYVATVHGDIIVVCTMELIEIKQNVQVIFEYTYQIIEKGKPTENGGLFLPWDSMFCITGFEEEKGQTRVTTVLHANGVNSFFKVCLTKVLGFFNGFQQRKSIARLLKSINDSE